MSHYIQIFSNDKFVTWIFLSLKFHLMCNYFISKMRKNAFFFKRNYYVNTICYFIRYASLTRKRIFFISRCSSCANNRDYLCFQRFCRICPRKICIVDPRINITSGLLCKAFRRGSKIMCCTGTVLVEALYYDNRRLMVRLFIVFMIQILSQISLDKGEVAPSLFRTINMKFAIILD